MAKKIIPAPLTSPKIKHIAGVGMANPELLTNQQIQELAASVEAHIEPRKQADRATARYTKKK
jgi:hypothetical protein